MKKDEKKDEEPLGVVPPPKIRALLGDPVFCSKIAVAWPEIREGILTILMELPLFCKKNDLDPGSTVIACNKVLTTFEVLRDAALHRQKVATHEKEQPNKQAGPK